MSEELHGERRVDRWWNGCVSGRRDDQPRAVAPASAEAIRAFQVVAKIPPPPASRDKPRPGCLCAIERAAKTHRRSPGSDELVILASADQPLSPMVEPAHRLESAAGQRRPWWGAALNVQLATAALVVLTLGASLVIFGGPLRQRGAREQATSHPRDDRGAGSEPAAGCYREHRRASSAARRAPAGHDVGGDRAHRGGSWRGVDQRHGARAGALVLWSTRSKAGARRCAPMAPLR